MKKIKQENKETFLNNLKYGDVIQYNLQYNITIVVVHSYSYNSLYYDCIYYNKYMPKTTNTENYPYLMQEDTDIYYLGNATTAKLFYLYRDIFLDGCYEKD
jgi:hypothetical protein